MPGFEEMDSDDQAFVLAQMADSDDVKTRARGVIAQVLTNHGVPVPLPLAVEIIRALTGAGLHTFIGDDLRAHIERVADRARDKGYGQGWDDAVATEHGE